MLWVWLQSLMEALGFILSTENTLCTPPTQTTQTQCYNKQAVFRPNKQEESYKKTISQ